MCKGIKVSETTTFSTCVLFVKCFNLREFKTQFLAATSVDDCHSSPFGTFPCVLKRF